MAAAENFRFGVGLARMTSAGGELKMKLIPGPPVASSAERAGQMRMNVNMNLRHGFGCDMVVRVVKGA